MKMGGPFVRTQLAMVGALCISCVFSGVCPGAEEVALPMEEAHWRAKAFPPEGVAAEEAAEFSIEEDPEKGPALAVANWRSGRWGARYEYAVPLPVQKGTVRGWYRTEGVGNAAAAVWIQYFRGDEYAHTEQQALEPAPEWRRFECVFRRQPPGTDRTYVGFGLRRKTKGKALFAGLSVSAEVPAVAFPEDPGEVTRPAPPTDLGKGKFFRLAERDGIWWLVTPQGRGFYSAGTDGPWLRSRGGWLEQGKGHAAWLREHGFNSLGGWTDIWHWSELNDALLADGKTPFAAFTAMETGTWWGDFDHLLDCDGKPQDERHAFPDPFDPRFENAYRERVREIAGLVSGKPWFLAWFADNEVRHWDLHRYVYSSHCAAKLQEFLEDRYESIEGLNEAWRTSLASFADLAQEKPDPTKGSPAMEKDYRDFSREIVKHYIRVTLRAIHEEDPGRLVFSNRFMFGDFSYLDLYAAYDGIAVNLYPDNNEPGLSAEEIAVVRRAHEETGKPVIIGEWSVPAIDSGLYDDLDHLDWSWPQVVETQTDRGRQAACIALDFHNLPFVVGAHWFTWRDFDSEKRRANRGLHRADGVPYRELAEALRGVHAKMGPSLRWRRREGERQPLG